MPNIPHARRYFAADSARVRDGVFGLTSRRNVRLQEGDGFLLFTRAGADVRFVEAALIGKITRTEGERQGPGRFDAVLAERMPFERPVALDEFAYSLPRIRNADQPWRHFLRPYTRLAQADVEVLAEEKVFWARTAMGLLARHVPLEVRRRIAFAVLERAPEAAGDLRIAWPLFRDEMEEAFLAPARMLVAIDEQLQALEAVSSQAFTRLLIRDPATEATLLLTRAAAESRKVLLAFGEGELDAPPQPRLLDALTGRVAEERPDDRFERGFTGRLWPFTVLA